MRYGAVLGEIPQRGLFRAPPDVMYHPAIRIKRSSANDNPDVRQARIEQPRDNVASHERRRKLIAGSGPRSRPCPASGTGKVRFEIQHAAMIDAGIGRALAPCFTAWIRIEVFQHIFMHKLLQVEAESIARGTYNHVGADATRSIHIAIGIWDAGPIGIVGKRNADLRASGSREFLTVRAIRPGTPHQRPSHDRSADKRTPIHFA
jgi:hypothetical protein